MGNKKRICVYCSSSKRLKENFYNAAKELGYKIAKNGYDMVYGGSTCGMMGIIADNALANGADVLGVIPKRIEAMGVTHPELANIIVTEDMRSRKAKMEEYADAFVAMPGGFGTFEEIFEIIVAKQLSYHNKPIVFVNIDGYYDNLFKMFETVYENNFAYDFTRDLYFIAKNIDEMFEYIENYVPKVVEFKY
ncbi:TIGR00730 family Rossman fold protein [bacterium]|nr:TIGR00730 family Rossman fold protein [bacterium]